MKKSFVISSLILFVVTMVLSGCFFPYWDDEGGGHHRGGYHEGGHHEGGERR